MVSREVSNLICRSVIAMRLKAYVIGWNVA
jgi:hypothetical protein